MKLSSEIIDNDSAHSPSDDEKTGQGAFQNLGHGELPPDPDAHLSLEERAAIVCSIHRIPPLSWLINLFKDRKLVWKLDLRLIPWLCLLYLIRYLEP